MTGRGWQPALGEPGELVTAIVSNPLENPLAQGKARPVVLVRRDGCRWFVMGLTRLPTYATGAPRTPVANPHAVGLNGPGFLWGERLTGISVIDLERHLGWVDADLAAAVIIQAKLGARDAAALIRAVGAAQAA